jgi:hypothetical protein
MTTWSKEEVLAAYDALATRVTQLEREHDALLRIATSARAVLDELYEVGPGALDTMIPEHGPELQDALKEYDDAQK